MVGTGAIVGITVGSVIAGIVILAFLTHFLRMWLRGPTIGSDNRKRLDGKVVAITGKHSTITQKFSHFFAILQEMACVEWWCARVSTCAMHDDKYVSFGNLHT